MFLPGRAVSPEASGADRGTDTFRRSRRDRVRCGVSVLLLLAVAGCVGRAPQPSAPPPEAEPDLVYPPPPAEPRLRWAESFRVPGDLGLRASIWRRAQRLLFGGPDDSLVRPQGIAVAGGRILLTDPGRPRVLVYDLQRKEFHALDASREFPWSVPTSVAAAPDGTVFVADAAGALFRVPADLGRAEALAWPGLDQPVAVAVDEGRGRLYVLDSHRHQLLWGTLDGAYRGSTGRRGSAPGEFNFPTHLAVTPDGFVYVTDAMNFRIQRLDAEGRVRAMFGQAGDGSGDFAKPKGIAVDRSGAIYVVDALHDVVQLFDEDGRFLMAFGESGHEEGQFWLPTGIAIDLSGRVYVADSYNRRVQVFAPVETAS